MDVPRERNVGSIATPYGGQPDEQLKVNAAMDLTTIYGAVQLGGVQRLLCHYATDSLGACVEPPNAESHCWMVQGIMGESSSGWEAVSVGQGIAGVGGAIWEAPGCGTSLRDIRDLLVSCVRIGNYAKAGEIEGDFVAVVLLSDRVAILRGHMAPSMLFYANRNGTLIWGTDFCRVARWSRAQLNSEYLALLAWGREVIPYDEVKAIPPGRALEIEYQTGNHRFHALRSVADETSCEKDSLRHWSSELRTTIQRAVALRAIPYPRIGVMLSGGIDSAAIAKCLCDAGCEVIAFHWDASGFEPAAEVTYAEAIAHSLRIPLRKIPTAKHRLPGSNFVDVRWRFALPYNHSLYRWWYDAVMVAKDEVDCLMSGFLGDGCFGRHKISRGLRSLRQVSLLDRLTYVLHTLSLNEEFRVLLDRHEPGCEQRVSFVRQVSHYSDWARAAVEESADVSSFLDRLQVPSLDVNLFYRFGLRHVAPYADASVWELSRRIPIPYKITPFRGQEIGKIVLRDAFIGELPPEVIRRNYRQYISGIIQGYCQNNIEAIRSLLGYGSVLSQMGIVDVRRLDFLLNDRILVLSHSVTLVVNCMVEIWLRGQRGEG